MIKILQYGVVSLLLLLVLYLVARVQNALYKAYRRIPLGDYPLWEFMAVDEVNRHLLVSHFNKVVVIDMDRDEIAGSIVSSNDVYGIAVAQMAGKGFACHRQQNAVSVFDLKTLAITGRIEGTCANPESIMYDAFSNRLFVFSSRNNLLTVIDPGTEKIINRIELPGKPVLAVSDESGCLLIQPDNSDMLWQVDVQTGAIARQYCIVAGEAAGGLAIDKANNLLFSAYDGRIIVTDITSGAALATVPAGTHPGAIWYDPAAGLIYCSNGEGTMSVVRQQSPRVYKLVQKLVTQNGSRLMVRDPVTQKLYLLGVTALNGRKTVAGSFEVLVYGIA
jgi:DNA-binding beta-propeller fold protein YncE